MYCWVIKHLRSISFVLPLQVADKIEQYKKDGRPVAGCCVEPVQSAGGDNHASPWFFQQLQQICKEVNNIQLCIVNILKYMRIYIYIYCNVISMRSFKKSNRCWLILTYRIFIHFLKNEFSYISKRIKLYIWIVKNL